MKEVKIVRKVYTIDEIEKQSPHAYEKALSNAFQSFGPQWGHYEHFIFGVLSDYAGLDFVFYGDEMVDDQDANNYLVGHSGCLFRDAINKLRKLNYDFIKKGVQALALNGVPEPHPSVDENVMCEAVKRAVEAIPEEPEDPFNFNYNGALIGILKAMFDYCLHALEVMPKDQDDLRHLCEANNLHFFEDGTLYTSNIR